MSALGGDLVSGWPLVETHQLPVLVGVVAPGQQAPELTDEQLRTRLAALADLVIGELGEIR